MSMIVDRIQELQHIFSNFNLLHQLQRNQRQTGRSSEWPPQCAFLFHYFEAQCKHMPEDRSQVNAIVHTNVHPLSSHPLKVFAEKKSVRWPSRSSVHQTDPTDLDNKVSETQADLHIQKNPQDVFLLQTRLPQGCHTVRTATECWRVRWLAQKMTGDGPHPLPTATSWYTEKHTEAVFLDWVQLLVLDWGQPLPTPEMMVLGVQLGLSHQSQVFHFQTCYYCHL